MALLFRWLFPLVDQTMPKLELKMPKPKLNFPLKLKKEEEEEEEVWPFKKTICETLEEAVKEHPYLASYLESLTEKPTYMLSSNLEKYEGGNVMYPLGLGIYAHIYVGGEIGKYNLVEPEKPNRELLDNVEVAVATLVKDKEYTGQKEKVLASFFRQAIKKKLVKIPKGLDENNILYFFLREKVGHGFLDGFLADPWLEDVSIPGQGKVFVYHKMFGHLETNVEVSKGEIDRLLRSIAEKYGKVLSYTHPIIDIHLPDGSSHKKCIQNTYLQFTKFYICHAANHIIIRRDSMKKSATLKLLGHRITTALRIPYTFALALYILILILLFGDPEEECA